ncbi:MAG TPA: hypothetical protein VFK26_12135 [Gemmatimonadaceae bacterium]|jgi:hypothetical protein|nr:hypothetical protein [Gemmatimonadaceae bacterium]
MARAYTVATAALALGVRPKWLDNTLSHFRIQGVQQARQGVARRLTVEALLPLATSIALTRELGIPMARALDLATKIVTNDGQIALGGRLVIAIDLIATRAELLRQLEHAVEVAPLPRRGRPPKNTTGRLE